MTEAKLRLPARLAILVAGIILSLAAAVGVASAASAADPHAEVCKTFAHRAKVESDPFGTDLAYLHLRQRVCFDGRRVTGAGRLIAYPEITESGTASNWKWEGWTREPFSHLKAVGRRSAGSRVLFAAGQFSQRVYKYTSTAQVWVKIRVYGDGYARRLALNG
jgi:hypothetical protein